MPKAYPDGGSWRRVFTSEEAEIEAMAGQCPPGPQVGDRVYAHYREHSIPTRSLGTVSEVVRGWATVRLDPPVRMDESDSDLVCVPLNEIEPLSSGDWPIVAASRPRRRGQGDTR